MMSSGWSKAKAVDYSGIPCSKVTGDICNSVKFLLLLKLLRK